jgi:phospholipid/cholesterol/gamma-HCH transport system permease protein
MEAASVRIPRQPGGEPAAAARASGLERLGSGLIGPVRSLVEGIGDFAVFAARAFGGLRGLNQYSGEAIRQAGVIIIGSCAVIWFMEFLIGTMCATEGTYPFRSYGATTYASMMNDYCGLREMTPYMIGYIVSAKIGCGLVAEIGSMRINEEIDAMESMGIDPMRFLVGTRLAAAMLTLPLIYLVGLTLSYLGGFLVIVLQVGEVSQASFEMVLWSFQDPLDTVYALIKIMSFGIIIVLVGMYFGWRARGGPVGVGTATARSMMVNLVAVHFVSMLLTAQFWGFGPRAPIGG